MVDQTAGPGARRPVTAPPVFQQVIPRRKALRDKLSQGLGHQVVLVQAGSGYGKTVVLAEFAFHQREQGIATAWLELDRIHQDRILFLGDLARAVGMVRPGVGNFTQDALQKSRDVHRRWDYFLELFCREIQESGDLPGTIILDQYERTAASSSASDIVDRIARCLPPGLGLILSSRQPPRLGVIARPTSRDGLFTLSATDLCFSTSEIAELLAQYLGATPSDDLVEMVDTKTGGWPAGVQMAAVFAARLGEKAMMSFAGAKPEFYDFLCDNMFQQEVEPGRSFLLNTALVESVSAGLCPVLAGEAEPLGLSQWIERRIFPGVLRRSEHGSVYIHNPVFHSYLLKKSEQFCSPLQLHDLRIKLAGFYECAREWDLSLYHLLEAGEYERAAKLVASQAEEAISRNNLETLARWLDAFPREERNKRPWLLLYEGLIHRISRDWDQALVLYNLAADVFRSQGDRKGLGRTLWYASQVLSYRRNQRLATLLASEALSYLVADETRARAWILHSMANSYFDLGQTEEALRSHEEAIRLFESLQDHQGQLTETQATGWALHRLGRLKEAQQYYVRALELQASTGDVNMLCWLQAGLAHIRALRGDYSESLPALIEVVDMARKHHLLPAEAFALSNLVDIYVDLGDYAEAESCYWQAVTACQGFEDDAPQIGLHLKRIELERRRGQLHAPSAAGSTLSLADWIEASNLELTKIAHDLQKAYLCLMERRYEDAVVRAREAGSLAKKIGAKYDDAQACYLLARALLLKEDRRGSAEVVGELLSLVEAEGYTGFLLRDPEATGELLMNAIHFTKAKRQVETLLARLAGDREDVAARLAPGEDSLVQKKLNAVSEILLSLMNDTKTRKPPADTRSAMVKRRNARERPGGSEAGSTPIPLDVQLLGTMKVHRDGLVITDRAWRTSKARELFAHLLTCNDYSASRDQLLDILWPNLGIDSAVSNFHFTVHSLRRALEPQLRPGQTSGYLITEGRYYSLQLPAESHIDLMEFRSYVSQGLKKARAGTTTGVVEALQRAIDLYHGEFMGDIYAEWVEPLRREILEDYQHALRHLALFAYTQGRFDEAIRHARAMLKKDSYSEEAHRLIMRAACRMGDPARALRQYEDLVRILKNELNAQPEVSSQKLYRQIHGGIPVD